MSGTDSVLMHLSNWRSACLGMSLEQEGLYMRMRMFLAETRLPFVPLNDSQAARMLGGINVNQYRKVLAQLVIAGAVERHEEGYALALPETFGVKGRSSGNPRGTP